MKFTQVDIENLPIREVLAINNRKEMLVGNLTVRSGGIYDSDQVVCDDENTELPNVTHYILSSDLINLLENEC